VHFPEQVFCGTWNVNAKKPDPDEDLLMWLNQGGEAPDLFCVGFQEIVDLTTVNVVADGKTRERSAVWCDRLLAAVNSMGVGFFKLVHEKVWAGSSLG